MDDWERLRRLARSFDAIGDEAGERYTAEAFVEWARVTADQEGRRNERAGKPGQRGSLASGSQIPNMPANTGGTHASRNRHLEGAPSDR